MHTQFVLTQLIQLFGITFKKPVTCLMGIEGLRKPKMLFFLFELPYLDSVSIDYFNNDCSLPDIYCPNLVCIVHFTKKDILFCKFYLIPFIKCIYGRRHHKSKDINRLAPF